MKEYEVSIIPMIEAKYETFTSVEKIIADFFINNTKDMDFRAKYITSLLHVSEASLSRFAKKMGYRGYREFIYQYQPALQYEKPQVEEPSIEVLNAYQELLSKTYNLISEEQITRIAQQMLEKKRIFIYGLGSSGLAAIEVSLRLLRMGLDVEAVTEIHTMIMNEVRVHKDCLTIGITLSGATREVLDALVAAKEKGATTILITSNHSSQFTSQFDEVVLTAVKKNLQYGNVISLQFPILILLDIIYSRYLAMDVGSKDKHDPTIWNKIKGYHNEIDRSRIKT